jgi:hypothetical protein
MLRLRPTQPQGLLRDHPTRLLPASLLVSSAYIEPGATMLHRSIYEHITSFFLCRHRRSDFVLAGPLRSNSSSAGVEGHPQVQSHGQLLTTQVDPFTGERLYL